LTTLWTFETQSKVEIFTAILQEAGIPCETQSKGKQKNSTGEVTISVDERDYERAKKLLVKYRKRKTNT